MPELRLDSRTYNQIANAPALEPDPDRLEFFARFQSDRHKNAELRRIAGFYNCFGLAFGGRRTWIENVASELEQIYREDHYRRIPYQDIVPGDLVMYRADGTIEHVAIVLYAGLWQADNQNRVVRVLSKWGHGPEFIHDMADVEFGVPDEFWTDRVR